MSDRLYNLHIFIDFDGTISGVNIGFDLFHRYGEQEPWHTQLMAGEIGIREYWRLVAASVREPLTDELVRTYLAEIPVDPGLVDLLILARKENIPVTVVSDGLDLYIRPFLALHGAGELDVYCNASHNDSHGQLQIRFNHAVEGCECLSAVCKRNVVLSQAAPEARIIYIGDGVSDHCPATHADIIFAKHSLAAYCNRERLPHYPFKTLSDVARQLRLLLNRKRIRPRYQAGLLRKKAFESE